MVTSRIVKSWYVEVVELYHFRIWISSQTVAIWPILRLNFFSIRPGTWNIYSVMRSLTPFWQCLIFFLQSNLPSIISGVVNTTRTCPVEVIPLELTRNRLVWNNNNNVLFYWEVVEKYRSMYRPRGGNGIIFFLDFVVGSLLEYTHGVRWKR